MLLTLDIDSYYMFMFILAEPFVLLMQGVILDLPYLRCAIPVVF